MSPDCDLLRQYAEQQDEAAFAEVVRRNVDLVYSVALRQLAGDTHLAQDVTQAVFLDLVRKARPLSRRATLAGWLHTSARLAAWKAVRGEQRRRAREQESLVMNETPTTAELNWEQLQPLLDEGVGQLDETDRDAIVLRFFEGKSHREVGTALGLSENSANKRIERALEKLRGYFARRGVTVPAAVLAAEVSANSVRAAPAGLAAEVARTSLAGAGTATVGSAVLLAIFMNTKTKVMLGLAAVLILGLTVAFEWHGSNPQPSAPDSTSGPIRPKAGAASVGGAKAAVGSGAAGPAASGVSPAALAANVAPGATTDSSGVQFVAQPQVDLETAIATGLHCLENKDLLGFFKTLMPPDGLENETRVSSLEDFAALAMQQPGMMKKIDQMTEALSALQNATPALNDDGTRATYLLDPPVAGYKAIIFNKVNGLWYLNGM